MVLDKSVYGCYIIDISAFKVHYSILPNAAVVTILNDMVENRF